MPNLVRFNEIANLSSRLGQHLPMSSGGIAVSATCCLMTEFPPLFLPYLCKLYEYKMIPRSHEMILTFFYCTCIEIFNVF